jgi:coproporphyrinogen III oxidase
MCVLTICISALKPPNFILPCLQELTRIDGTPFAETNWVRPGNGGGGRSRVLEGGAVFEKAGVNISVVHGSMPKAAAHASLPRMAHLFSGPGPFPFHAVGISLVLHPRNPFAPTMHANYRFFEATGVGVEVRGGR